MNHAQTQPIVRWPSFRLAAPTRLDRDIDTGFDVPANSMAVDIEIEPIGSTVRKIVVNGRVVMQDNLLQATMQAMVRRAVTQESPVALN